MFVDSKNIRIVSYTDKYRHVLSRFNIDFIYLRFYVVKRDTSDSRMRRFRRTLSGQNLKLKT